MYRLTCKQEYFHSCHACKHLISSLYESMDRLAVAGQRPAPRVVMHTFTSLPPCSGEIQSNFHRNLKDIKHSDLSLLGQQVWPVSVPLLTVLLFLFPCIISASPFHLHIYFLFSGLPLSLPLSVLFFVCSHCSQPVSECYIRTQSYCRSAVFHCQHFSALLLH